MPEPTAMVVEDERDRFRGGLPGGALRRVRTYIDEHIGERIYLSELARQAGVSRFHFARQFRLSTGESPMEYLRRVRIDRSKRILETRRTTIAEVAAGLGFSDQSHFTRTFGRLVGVSPASFARSVDWECRNRAVRTGLLAAIAIGLGSLLGLSGQPALAQVRPFPPSFHNRRIATNGTSLYVRVGGRGPAVVLLHGYGETGDMWSALAAKLVPHYTVVVPDLRGMGLSARPSGGYDKKTQGHDIAGVLDALKIDKTELVTHDIGNMVGYAFAAEYPNRVGHFVLIDAPLPGVGPWDDIVKSHALWHFSFWGPDAERLVKGRERIYLDRLWNQFSADPKSFPEASRAHYARLYARPGAMHAGFEQFKAFDQDVIDNKAFVAQGKLTMPVLALGGEKSFGPMMAVVMRAAATNVAEGIVPHSGHWIMEENPAATIALVTDFLAK